ncbi:S8/S53 family peptidase [Pseudenhygromyxa sp. WMMC2535]|uniref:S8/S53 family peptidase n=1 Tax=Pseudenhygromyxa sp. WMMC2535 TaxID=2712867 RepID=UPI001557C4B9|nr:S8/S53 family peptidase [Pseudenhygromyxa sp. WMMC2535]
MDIETAFALTFTLGVAAVGCTDTDTGASGEDEDSTGLLEGAPGIGCPGAHLIGVLDDPADSCELDTLPDGWSATRLFESGSPGLVEMGREAPGELGRYCAFNPEFDALEEDYDEMLAAVEASTVMQLGSVGTDCMGEAPQSGLNEESVRAALGEAFRENIDWVSELELGDTQAEREYVAVGVVDTVSALAGRDEAILPLNEHGLQMAALVRDIACPGGESACVSGVFHAMAMPRESWEIEPDWLVGGDNGTQGDIALGIYEAVVGWQAQREADPEGTPSRLILNLSLGWERELPDSLDPSRGPARAVEAALQYAACQGALVFVSTGNNPDEDCPHLHRGVLAPADLEQSSAPTVTECERLGFPLGGSEERPVFGDDEYRPLVYAVDGVDEFDHRLINGREGGASRLAALGTRGVSMSDSQTALTGTSVSAAVATGVAALIWSYRPQLRPHEVAELLYASGWGLGKDADIAWSGDESGADLEIHRISVCAALASACAGGSGPACPELDCEAQPAAGATYYADYFAEVEAAVSNSTTITFSTELSGDDPVCAESVSSSLASPQPEVPVCPYCNVDVPPDTASTEPDDTVIMSVAADYQGSIISVSMIAYDDERNETIYDFDDEVVESLNDSSVGVTQVIIEAPADISSATLIFGLIDETGETTSQSNPITVQREG